MLNLSSPVTLNRSMFKSLSTALAITLLSLALLSSGALAQTGDNPPGQLIDKSKSHIQSMADEAINIIESQEELGYKQAKERFRDLVQNNFDVKTISRFTLGRYWRAASDQQQKEFTRLVQSVILDKYADRILNYNGERFTVNGARAVSDKDVMVNMTVKPQDNSAVTFAWRTRQFEEGPKVIDLSIEGISMSVTHRNEFSSIIQRNGGQVGALIQKLKDKETEQKDK